MAQIDVYNLRREKVDQVQLEDSVFGAPVKEHLHYDAVKMQFANRRSGTACAKTRAEVSYSTAKLYRQKGTGNARKGSRRSPTLRGGGAIFGPRPRDYFYRIPRQSRKAALRSALSSRVISNKLIVVDSFALPVVRTKFIADVFRRFELKNALVVDTAGNNHLRLSTRNLQSFKFLAVEGVNVADILRFESIVMTLSAARALEGVLKR